MSTFTVWLTIRQILIDSHDSLLRNRSCVSAMHRYRLYVCLTNAAKNPWELFNNRIHFGWICWTRILHDIVGGLRTGTVGSSMHDARFRSGRS